MKIEADRSKCIGAGQCVMVAPFLFAQGDDDGLVIVTKPEPSGEEIGDAELAVLSCPSQVLRLIDD